MLLCLKKLSNPQDEAADLLASDRQSNRATPEEALAYLSRHCELAVVTLGDKGCIARRQGETDTVQEPACSGVTVIDATGAMLLSSACVNAAWLSDLVTAFH